MLAFNTSSMAVIEVHGHYCKFFMMLTMGLRCESRKLESAVLKEKHACMLVRGANSINSWGKYPIFPFP